jgi:hypothetical protein
MFSAWYLSPGTSCDQSRKGEVREPFLHLLFLKCFQLKITKVLKWHSLMWCVLNTFRGFIKDKKESSLPHAKEV